MATRLGFQLYSSSLNTAVLEQVRKMQPVALLVVGDATLLDRAYDTLGPGTVYMFRASGVNGKTAEAYIAANGTVENAVQKFLSDYKTQFQAVPWAYHCTPPLDTLTAQQAQFETLLIKGAGNKYGTRLCVGNFAPGIPAYESLDIYKQTLETAADYSALIGVREAYPIFPYVGYGPNSNIPDANLATSHKLRNELPYPQGYLQPGLIVGHYRYIRDYCRRWKIPVQLVITQMGAGRALDSWMEKFGSGLNGWHSLRDVWKRLGYADLAAHYFQDIQWLDQHVYTPDPEVVGACLYTWNAPSAPDYEIGNSSNLLTFLDIYLEDARRTQPPNFETLAFDSPASFEVIASSVRIRPLPSLNTINTDSLARGKTLTATHYTFNSGYLWVKHSAGWSAYTPLKDGNPDYDGAFLKGQLILTPRQIAAQNNFVGTIEDVRNFLKAHRQELFYIDINPDNPPDGARHFSITTFSAAGGRQVIDTLHPEAGDPAMTPEAKKILRNNGQL